MLRNILLILFLCGLTVFSVILAYRARAEPSPCSPRGRCVPVQPPDCVGPDCGSTATNPAADVYRG